MGCLLLLTDLRVLDRNPLVELHEEVPQVLLPIRDRDVFQMQRVSNKVLTEGQHRTQIVRPDLLLLKALHQLLRDNSLFLRVRVS